MWLSATKGGIMKDIKPKVISVTKNVRATFYEDGGFDLCFHTMVIENGFLSFQSLAASNAES